MMDVWVVKCGPLRTMAQVSLLRVFQVHDKKKGADAIAVADLFRQVWVFRGLTRCGGNFSQ